jgi:hypothetical protein
MGWTKARELVKVARREGQEFDCAPRVHKASSMPREEFNQEAERHLTGQESEPHEILYFKVYKGQPPVIEDALHTAGLMLGPNKSMGYCLEMICADFLAGADWERRNNRFDYAKFNRSAASTPIGPGRVQHTPNPGPGARWLAVSRMRLYGESHETQGQAR